MRDRNVHIEKRHRRLVKRGMVQRGDLVFNPNSQESGARLLLLVGSPVPINLAQTVCASATLLPTR